MCSKPHVTGSAAPNPGEVIPGQPIFRLIETPAVLNLPAHARPGCKPQPALRIERDSQNISRRPITPALLLNSDPLPIPFDEPEQTVARRHVEYATRADGDLVNQAIA